MISNKIENNLKKSSWIRAMFEEGDKLRKIHGNENVFDLSIGNPEFEPPQGVKSSIKDNALSSASGVHRYMANSGYDFTRKSIADYLNKEKGLNLKHSNIVMTCGAAGGLNVVLKTILNPEDEVIVFSPYFVEYLFYIDNHGGKSVIVKTRESDFQPDMQLLEGSITSKTKAILINTPNNPTGVIYSDETLKQISEIIDRKQAEYNSQIYVISDEPYDRIVYNETNLPCVFNFFKTSVIVNSFSKSLALPGERIGFIAVNTAMPQIDLFLSGLNFCNRTLGFVNAPAFMQRVVSESISESVDVLSYKKRCDLMYNHLISLGFKCVKPDGAFYLFPESLIPDDIAFVKTALEHNILLVPGTGFGCPGYFRLAYCLNMETLERSLPAFEKLSREFK